MIQVDFEAQTPQDSDFHGIKKLLEQVSLYYSYYKYLFQMINFIIIQSLIVPHIDRALGPIAIIFYTNLEVYSCYLLMLTDCYFSSSSSPMWMFRRWLIQ